MIKIPNVEDFYVIEIGIQYAMKKQRHKSLTQNNMENTRKMLISCDFPYENEVVIDYIKIELLWNVFNRS